MLLANCIHCCLFDLDGVLTPTASLHEASWKQAFDEFLTDRGLAQFTNDDYLKYVDGRNRLDGVRRLLKSRSLQLPEAVDDDAGPEVRSIARLAEHKNQLLLERLRHEPVLPYPQTRPCLEALRNSGFLIGVVSSSENAVAILEATNLRDLVDVVVDGLVAKSQGLAGKPSPATFLHAAEILHESPDHCAIFEDATAGVAAGHAGHFALTVGVGPTTRVDALINAGADIVVADLSEIAFTQRCSHV